MSPILGYIENTIAGLEAELKSAQGAGGELGSSWYFPSATTLTDAGTIKTTLYAIQKAKETIRSIINAPGTDSTTLANGLAMIAIYDKRIKQYSEAIAAAPQTFLPPEVMEEPLPVAPVAETGFDSKYLLWAGLGLLILLLLTGKNGSE